MKHKLSRGLILLAGLFLIQALPAHAHNQPGPPYLMIQGQYADTNPISGAAPDLIPQDQVGQTFVTGQDVEFKVDESRIGVSGQYRWKFGDGDKDYAPGNPVKHAYSKPGSFVMILQVNNELTGNEFIDYDTAQVNVAPKAGYKMPSAKVKLSTKIQGDNLNMTFTAVDSHDPSTTIASYQWLFGDGGTANQKVAKHTFQAGTYRYFPLLAIKDANGLQVVTAFQLDINDKKVEPSSLPFLPNVVVGGANISKALQLPTRQILFGAGILLIIGAIIFPIVMLRKK